jgi:hypothetical protein
MGGRIIGGIRLATFSEALPHKSTELQRRALISGALPSVPRRGAPPTRWHSHSPERVSPHLGETVVRGVRVPDS